ncbi:hypothetical protein BY458DRAFT_501171 [Sporodiniella umbellata]|nr:hypothetical protein BY458DRAFT_501171 [Sporodiniella umbellata]
MDLYQKPQDQLLLTDLNSHMLSHSGIGDYEGPFNRRNNLEVSSSAGGDICHPSNSPSILSTHSNLPQQAVDNRINSLANPDELSDDCSLPSSHSAAQLIPSNVISSDTQLPTPQNDPHSAPNSQMYRNESLILQQNSLCNISPSITNMDVNRPAPFAYQEQQQQNQNAHVKNNTEIYIEAQARGAIQSSPEVYSHSQPPIRHPQMTNSQTNLGHLVVPSQRMLNKPRPIITRRQYTTEEQERVAATAQQVMAQRMAQQYALLKHIPSNDNIQPILPSQHSTMISVNNASLHSPISPQDMQHVVLSQMPMLSPSFQSSSNINSAVSQKNDTSLHDAVLHQQHQKYQESLKESSQKRPLEDLQQHRRKSRRHTVSNSSPSTLRVGTSNLSTFHSSPKSATVSTEYNDSFTSNDILQNVSEQQTKKNEITDSSITPFQQELKDSLTTFDADIKDYNRLSRAQLISRLISLESERLQSSGNQNEKPLSLLIEGDENNIVADDEDEDDDEDEGEIELLEDQKKHQKTPCKWKDCRLEFDLLPDLIAHVNNEHIGSGKPSYYCEWENCQRNEKPFTKRHKIFNHLRTHTGERPFICEADGCGKKFSRPDSLSTHIKTHSNIRPYICRAKDCGKAYYHARSLKKHEKSHETATLVTHIQFPTATDSSFDTIPFNNTLTGQMDYMGIQLQPSSMMHTSPLPSSAQHPMAHQNTKALQSLSPTKSAYTPSNNMLLFSPAGMVEQQQRGNPITQNLQLESVNQQHIYNHQL